MKTTDVFGTWTCEKCGNTYSSSIEYCPNDGYNLQEGIKSSLFEELKEVKITRIVHGFSDDTLNSFHYQPYDKGIVTIHYIKSENI